MQNRLAMVLTNQLATENTTATQSVFGTANRPPLPPPPPLHPPPFHPPSPPPPPPVVSTGLE